MLLALIFMSEPHLSSQVFGEPKLIFQNICGDLMIESKVDCDDKTDLLFSGYQCLRWFEYDSREEIFYPQEFKIDTNIQDFGLMYSVDLDSDGDSDLIVAPNGTTFLDHIFWLENRDCGSLFIYHLIDDFQTDGRWSLSCADVDGDGLLDIIGANDSSLRSGSDTVRSGSILIPKINFLLVIVFSRVILNTFKLLISIMMPTLIL